ncbi:hypothetical protein A2U01_0096882, partial [Trifolium medium]|nr:hypothetical protein [Trifolium medium]
DHPSIWLSIGSGLLSQDLIRRGGCYRGLTLPGLSQYPGLIFDDFGLLSLKKPSSLAACCRE